MGDSQPIAEAAFKKEVADSPTKSLVLHHGSAEPLGVLQISTAVDLETVGDSVRKAARAKRVLGPDLGKVILVPIAEGSFEGRTYAIWPWHRPMRQSVIGGRLDRAGVAPSVFSWLLSCNARTRMRISSNDLQEFWLDPLRDIAYGGLFGGALRSAARRALERSHDGTLKPYSVLEHNDLWVGNILLPHRSERACEYPDDFILIDWGGSRVKGLPFLDLIRFMRSAKLSRSWTRRELLRAEASMNCTRLDVEAYVLAAIGAIGRRLNHFPVARFQKLGNNAFDFLRSIPYET